jgi:teichuronic acid biosynthesis glycosyltransferase TuaH
VTTGRGKTTLAPESANNHHFDVICCSLEPWDEVWRRNQLLATELLTLRPTMRLLFAELPLDMALSLVRRRFPRRAGLRAIGPTGRLWAMTPRKWLPRRVWPTTDRALGDQVRAASRRLGLERPLLWINDNSYADLAVRTGWPTVYDVTDDWLLAYRGATTQRLARQRRNDQLLVETADEVTVCSPALAKTRGQSRGVHLISNGVDTDHLRRPQHRPPDLPLGTVVLYLGSLNDGRLDVDLCVRVAEGLRGRATAVFVGPNSLSARSAERLEQAGAVLLGSRPYSSMPAYLQHADVLMVPHRINPFTESLDPIKAREFLTVGRPTISTPVAGFRELAPAVLIANAEIFVNELSAILDRGPIPPGPGPLTTRPPTWTEQAAKFLTVLDAAAGSRSQRSA